MSLTNQQITPFDFKGHEVRVLPHGDEFWFLATDVCEALELANHRQVVSRLDDDERGVHIMDTLGGKQETLIISESGLYSLVLTSRKAEAKAFKRWVTHEVLPALRKTGRYEIQPQAAPTALDALEQIVGALRLSESRMAALEADSQITKAKVEAITGGSGYFTVRGYANLNGVRIPTAIAAQIGRKAGKLARTEGYVLQQAIDELYGAVNSYPETVLERVFEEMGL